MRDGTFTIANGAGSKVLSFSSYGDLLLELYDPAVNPDPVGLSIIEEGEEVASTRRAVRHTLPEMQGIAVNSEDTIYLAARGSSTLAVTDQTLGVLLEGIVLRFDRSGRALPYLGMDGAGGTPFPPIESISLTARDELVVICRIPDARMVYWFSAQGAPLYQTFISETQIPPLPGGPRDALVVVQSLCPDQNRPALHVLADYFRENVDKSTGTVTAVVPVGSALHRLDLETAVFDSSHELPAVRPGKVQSGGREMEIPGARYQLLGVVEQGAAFLMRPEGSGVYEIAVLDVQGRLAHKRRILIDDEELTYMTLHLSSRGILSALLCDATRAHVVWWRCDRILDPAAL